MLRRPPLFPLFPYTTLFRSTLTRGPKAWVLNGGVADSGAVARYLERLRAIVASGFATPQQARSEEHTSELQSPYDLVCRLLLEKKQSGSVASRRRGSENDAR